MHFLDLLALLLIAVSAAAFFLGSTALARAEDVRALYWLAVGVVGIRAAMRVARFGVRA